MSRSTTNPRIAPLRAAVGGGLLLLVAVSSCRQQPLPRFELERETAGSAAEVLPAPVWRNRVQHTDGRVGEDLFPCLSPDGQTLYFSTSRFSLGFDLVAKSIREYTLGFLTNGSANDIHPSVSPDGETLAFASDRSGFWNLHVLPTRGGGVPERFAPSEVDTLGPRWSPDGRSIVCFRRGIGEDRWEICIVDRATETTSLLTEGLFPAWSPQGDWIVFQRARRRDRPWYSIWKIRPDGTHLTDLMSGQSDTWGAVYPSWSPDGRWIAFTAVGKQANRFEALRDAQPLESDIYLLSSNGQQLIDLTGDRSGISEWNPHFGSDWRVYFSANAAGATRLWSTRSPVEGDR